MSAFRELIAGTRTTRLTRDFLPCHVLQNHQKIFSKRSTSITGFDFGCAND
jgi:hypothetical protein